MVSLFACWQEMICHNDKNVLDFVKERLRKYNVRGK